ncbi:MAG: hypothetical protein RMM08_02440 [Armatimonadota bacterium]|nr:hypothetical protein [bacterium]MDW8320199.1 hypothetical protein [Armatimonadota bacterium]
METALRLRTRVLAGHRIEIVDPELPEGDSVEVIVLINKTEPRPTTLYEVLTAQPPRGTPLAAPSWEEYDRLLQQEREEWQD